jgi:hypothetical protein
LSTGDTAGSTIGFVSKLTKTYAPVSLFGIVVNIGVGFLNGRWELANGKSKMENCL